MLAAAALAALAGLLPVVAAFECPSVSWGPPPKTDLQEGAACGGACNFQGSCARGLSCSEPPRTRFQQLGIGGLKPPGVCAKVSSTITHGIMPDWVLASAMELLNARLDGLYKLVPVGLHGLRRHLTTDGLVYELTVEVQLSTCWNDGKHRPDTGACKPVVHSKRQAFRAKLLDRGHGNPRWRSGHLTRFSLLRLVPTVAQSQGMASVLV